MRAAVNSTPATVVLMNIVNLVCRNDAVTLHLKLPFVKELRHVPVLMKKQLRRALALTCACSPLLTWGSGGWDVPFSGKVAQMWGLSLSLIIFVSTECWRQREQSEVQRSKKWKHIQKNVHERLQCCTVFIDYSNITHTCIIVNKYYDTLCKI